MSSSINLVDGKFDSVFLKGNSWQGIYPTSEILLNVGREAQSSFLAHIDSTIDFPSNQFSTVQQSEEYIRALEHKVQQLTEELQSKTRQLEQQIQQYQQAEMILQKANHELYRLATTDSLTHIANRRRFDEYLYQQWQQMIREKAPLSLLLCDVDFFKRYNDTYGHQAGDRCLQSIAQVISFAVKRPSDLVARYGGEEFVVILPDTNAEGAIKVAQAIQEQIQKLEIFHIQSDISDRVTLSIGVATMVPTLRSLPKDLMTIADEALYEAKEQGRDRIISHNR